MFFRQTWTDERLTLPNNISNVAVSTKLLRFILQHTSFHFFQFQKEFLVLYGNLIHTL